MDINQFRKALAQRLDEQTKIQESRQDRDKLTKKIMSLYGEVSAGGWGGTILTQNSHLSSLRSFAKAHSFDDHDLVLEYDDAEGGHYNSVLVVLGVNNVIVSDYKKHTVYAYKDTNAILTAVKKIGNLN
jgi:hypothetical protein